LYFFMRKLLLICFLFVFLFTKGGHGQCTSCNSTYTNYNSSSNFTFPASTKSCFTGTNTISHDITFGNNASLCVEPDATLTIAANNYTVGSTNDIFTIDVYGTLNINQNPQWTGKMFINVHSGATLSTPNTLKLNGPEITIINDGTWNAGTLEFQTSGATITIINNSIMNVTQTFNISAGNAWFRNSGTLTIANNYSSDATSVYVNCGYYSGKFNLNSGGKVINTGTFNSSQIDFGNSSSYIENYGYFNFSGSTINPSGGTIYNQGIFTFVSGKISGDGNLIGPSNPAYRGYFVWSNTQKAVINFGTIGPNLNFRNPSGTSSETDMFETSANRIWGTGITWGNAEPGSLPPTACPEASGKPGTPSPIQTSVCVGADLTTLQTNYANVGYEWWTGSASARTTQITGASLTNYPTAGTIYLWAKNVYSGTYSDLGTAVTVVPDPIVTISPASYSVCVGGPATLTANVSGGAGTASYQWQSSIDNSTFNDISSATSSTYNAPTTTPGIRYYKVNITQTGSGCAATSGSVAVTVTALPTTATVGGTQNLCGTLVSGALGGNTPAVGTGLWTKVSGPGTTTFSNSASGSSTATVTSYGTYVYQWTISNGTCTASSAQVTVNYYQSPGTASVGSAQSICGLVSGNLGGNAIAVVTATWTKISGPGTITFSNANSGSSTATASAYGTYVLRWTFPANGTCPGSQADVTVNYYATPTTATVGGTQNLCGTLVSGALGGNTPAVGTGLWSQISGPGTTTFSNSASGSSTATVTSYGTYVYQWTISNGTCTAISAQVTVNYKPLPITTEISTE
jgi:hypothetical protein